MVDLDVTCHLEAFRRFLINSTCRSFIPESYIRDPEVFPEKEMDPGSIYIEAADKVTLKKIRDITFINARDILGIIYTSKSGNTKLKWRQLQGPMGRVTGDASSNSLVNLSMARIITPEFVEEILGRTGEGGERPYEMRAEERAENGPVGASQMGQGAERDRAFQFEEREDKEAAVEQIEEEEEDGEGTERETSGAAGQGEEVKEEKEGTRYEVSRTGGTMTATEEEDDEADGVD
jgi:hypothetical protein